MKGRNEVPWSELALGLKHVFSCILYANTERKANEPLSAPDRKLTENDLAYIKMRLFNGIHPSETNPMITWGKFFTVNISLRLLC